jgi:hypothetical protein
MEAASQASYRPDEKKMSLVPNNIYIILRKYQKLNGHHQITVS